MFLNINVSSKRLLTICKFGLNKKFLRRKILHLKFFINFDIVIFLDACVLWW
jgi:hypothetical protein